MDFPISCIYVGRLDAEKGMDLILEVMESLLSEGVDITLDIYGGGVLESQVQGLAKQFKQISYHGYTPKAEILKKWKDMDYCLMPSLFLETFGLTALDSLGVGVPIIAPSKGGLASFVSDELTLTECTVDVLKQTVMKAIELKKDHERYDKLSNSAYETYVQYSYDSRYHQLKKLGLPQELLLISDYEVNHGGIETLLEEIYTQLQKSGHTIQTISGTQKKLSKLQRYLGLVKTMANFGVAKQLIALEKTNQLIWRHSVHRQLGWLPLACSSSKNTHRIMIHDMGLLHPFPSSVYNESQIEKSKNFWGRMSEGLSGRSWVWLPFIFAKWISAKMIWWQIEKKQMLIQVPSEYLVAHVGERVKECRVVCVPHFVLLYGHEGNR